MGIVRPIWIPEYTGPASTISILRIGPGGAVTTVSSSEKADTDTGVLGYSVRNVFVWGGNIYFPTGSNTSTVYGWMSYNPRTQKFHHASYLYAKTMLIPVGAFVGSLCGSVCQRGPSPLYSDIAGSTPTFAAIPRDWAQIDGNVFITDASSKLAYWAYPFTAAPSTEAKAITRLCAFKGYMYGLKVTDNGTSYLYKYDAGWSTIGSFTFADNTCIFNSASGNSFFEYNGKLWIVNAYDQWGSYHCRCWEVDVDLGTITERADLLPLALKSSPANNQRVFEVIDDSGYSRQVFIFVAPVYGSGGGWTCYEFSDGAPWTQAASGLQTLGANAGAIWDTTAKSCHIDSAADSVPSDYMTIQHRVSDLAANGNVTVDLKHYESSDSSEAPPYTSCATEKAGVSSEGLSGLFSKPSGISSLSDLSDDFEDGVIDSDLWEKVNPAWGETRDYGTRYCQGRVYYPMEESNGRISFGAGVPASITVQHNGVGVKSKWGMDGAFQFDVTLDNLAALRPNNSKYYKLIALAKSSTNKGYGVFVWKNGSSVLYANGFSMTEQATCSISGNSTAHPADGSVLRIARDASNVWTLRLNPDSDNEDLLPANKPAHADDMQIWLFGVTNYTTHWVIATPGPGFSDLDVSGAGSLGKYEGEVSHNYMWDHVSDLGAGFSSALQLFADTN